MAAIHYIVHSIIGLYIFVIFLSVIMSWLVAFNVVNRHNQFVDMIMRTVYGLTEPVMRPVRNFLPAMGGIDISPIIVLIGLNALRIALETYLFFPAMQKGL